MKMRGLVPVLMLLLVAGCNSESNGAVENVSAEDSADAVPPPPPPPPPGALVFCPEVGRRISQQDCDDLTAVADQARQGVAAFNAPEPMYRGKTVTLQLAIGFAPPPAEPGEMTPDNVAAGSNDIAAIGTPDVGEAISNAAAGHNRPEPARVRPVRPVSPSDTVGQLPGKVVSYQPVVGRYMRATLTGEGFAIKARSAEQQELFIGDQTTWEWDVTAEKGERHVLTLKTVVEGVTADGRHYPLRSTTRNQVIDVKLSTADKLHDWLDAVPGWLKLATAALTGLAALFGAVWAVVRAARGTAR
ncbi:hypothetical protein [Sphingomonas quercus]|uniref:DUF3153 domain-containing protein n=1 Tax=Sphingomonas quercus TaxID=2842451 RepID=A0ABS6BFL0_9SPHN|nr:hypothetical protein [Sphingomonas quercus]MBU3077073.1 hypothetical protein [Sphingomonas quercus]